MPFLNNVDYFRHQRTVDSQQLGAWECLKNIPYAYNSPATWRHGNSTMPLMLRLLRLLEIYLFKPELHTRSQ
jgi:hypothetical protein